MTTTAPADTPETLQECIDVLDELVPTSPTWAKRIADFRRELVEQLATTKAPKQGSLL